MLERYAPKVRAPGHEEVLTLLGPSVAWYLCVGAFLFSTGALGVLLRRNPIIVLLSLEIMLNGGNLALIGYSRHLASGAGQIFAISVMAIAASEVVVGLGLVVAMNRKQITLDVDRMNTLRG
jgi:NADH-quinone oxidoreductase subunit K